MKSEPERIECWCATCNRTRIVSTWPDDTVADLLRRLNTCPGCSSTDWAMHDDTGKHTIILSARLNERNV